MKFVLFVLAITGFSSAVSAAKVNGHVKNQAGENLAHIRILITDTNQEVITDENGYFEVQLDAGHYTLDVKGGASAHFHQEIQVGEEDQVIVLTLEEEKERKMVIRANPLEHTAVDMPNPIVLISDDEMTLKRSTTLGDVLHDEPGLSVSSFGPAVSRPVIRGLSGSRVMITNNQMSVQDASTASPDHDVGVEPLLANSIEIIKGPATLLYGSGAIAGVVNITDKKIFAENQDAISGGVELRIGDSATGEKTGVFALDLGNNNSNWHFDGFYSKSDEIAIPSTAESVTLQKLEAVENQVPYVPEEVEGELHQSDYQTKGGSIGYTKLLNDGYVGLSINHNNKEYGVPGHAHEVDPLIAEAGVRVDMEQTRYDIQSGFENINDFINKLFIGVGYTDYYHVEVEDGIPGTEFENKAWELRGYIKQGSSETWEGVIGWQSGQRDFSAIGDESFVPPSTTKTSAIFWIEEKRLGHHKFEIGSRYESQKIEVLGGADYNDSAFSFSTGFVYTTENESRLAFNFSHASRFPSVENLYSYGPHATTQTFEIGNASLKEETANNVDFSYRFDNSYLTGEINFYFNHFDDFIFAANKDATSACVTADAAADALLEGLQLVCYEQQHADFKGVELKIEMPISKQADYEISLEIIADVVKAEFEDGQNVPRIPPVKTGALINYISGDLGINFSWLSYRSQNNLYENELPTNGFEMVGIDATYRMQLDQEELFIFVKGNNLLDEEARDHSSFLKDLAPRTGRNIILGMRYIF